MPERWLDGDTSTPRAADNIRGPRTGDVSTAHAPNTISLQTTNLTTLQSHSFPFGFGSRICVGRHLALMVMQLVVAGLVRDFDVEVSTFDNGTTFQSDLAIDAALTSNSDF